MPDDFEERHLNLLRNIEFAVVRVFRRHPEMTDWDVLKVYESLIKLYRAEATNYPTPVFSLNPLTQELFDFVKSMGERKGG